MELQHFPTSFVLLMITLSGVKSFSPDRLRVEFPDSNGIEPDPCEGFKTDHGYRDGSSDYGYYERFVGLLGLEDLELVGRTGMVENLRVICGTETVVGCPEGMIHDSDGLCESVYPEIETQD